ncbi:MAG: rhodanese-like domain-containing protein [Pseudomonadota bacterium]
MHVRKLVLCLATLMSLLIGSAIAAAAGSSDISVVEAHNRAQSGDLVLVDIRAPKEWAQSGVPESGQLITMYQQGDRFLAALKKAAGGDTSKPVALICATGVRSLRLQSALQRAGFKNVINVLGGMFGTPKDKGWIKAGLPVSKFQR